MGTCDDIAEGGSCLDQARRALVVKAGRAGGKIHLRQILFQPDHLDLGVPIDSHPGVIGHDELCLALLVRIERIIQPEWGILAGGNPVLLARDVAEQLSFHMGDTTYQDRLLLRFLLSGWVRLGGGDGGGSE